MAAAKVQVIQDWPEPRKIKDIQSFLGFANFYRHFILHYSDIAVPLTCLTRKGSAWDFSDKCHSTFNRLKKAFTTAPVLMHWIPVMWWSRGPMAELLSPLAVMSEGLGFNLCIAPFLNVGVLNLSQRVEDIRGGRSWVGGVVLELDGRRLRLDRSEDES